LCHFKLNKANVTWLDVTKPNKELAPWKTSITRECGVVRGRRHTLHLDQKRL